MECCTSISEKVCFFVSLVPLPVLSYLKLRKKSYPRFCFRIPRGAGLDSGRSKGDHKHGRNDKDESAYQGPAASPYTNSQEQVLQLLVAVFYTIRMLCGWLLLYMAPLLSSVFFQTRKGAGELHRSRGSSCRPRIRIRICTVSFHSLMAHMLLVSVPKVKKSKEAEQWNFPFLAGVSCYKLGNALLML